MFKSEELSNEEHKIKCVITDRGGKQQANLDYLKVYAPADSSVLDKSNLQDVITEASVLSEEAYPQDKWAELQKVYKEAVAVMNKDDAKQDEIDKAAEALEAAISALGKAQPPVVKQETGKAILVESKQIVLEWDKVQGAKAYEITENEHQVKAEATDTFVRVTGLEPGTTYNFKIYAVNEGGKSEKAIEINEVTTTNPNEGNTIPPVTEIVKTVTGKDSVKLTWKAPTDTKTAGYIVYVDGVKKGVAEKEAFTLQGLVKNQIYVVKIIAFDEEGHKSVPAQFAFSFEEEEKEGWVQTGNGWEYYENGNKAIGWKDISGTWYYFNDNGIMETGWAEVNGHWYFLNNSGAMETGWVFVNGHWYYMDQWGAMCTGWVSVNGHWYYMDQWGAMCTGWVSVNGHWYYMDQWGAMQTGWVFVGGYWYYLNADGAMASNQWIDGYYVGASGQMI